MDHFSYLGGLCESSESLGKKVLQTDSSGGKSKLSPFLILLILSYKNYLSLVFSVFKGKMGPRPGAN